MNSLHLRGAMVVSVGLVGFAQAPPPTIALPTYFLLPPGMVVKEGSREAWPISVADVGAQIGPVSKEKQK